MNKMNKRGFTLIEMLVVIAVIAILVAIVVPAVSNATLKSRGAADAANLRTIAAEAMIEYMDGDTVTTEYTLESKIENDGLPVSFYLDDEENLIPVVECDDLTVTTDYFAYIAEHGEKNPDLALDLEDEGWKIVQKAEDSDENKS